MAAMALCMVVALLPPAGAQGSTEPSGASESPGLSGASGPSGVQVMGATLPAPRDGIAAVWTGREVLLFGGCDYTGPSYTCFPSSDILSYDPSSDTLRHVGSLPHPMGYAAAVWTGSEAYVFGGQGNAHGPRQTWDYDEIVRFAAGEVQVLASRLPKPIHGLSAAWTGSEVLLMGGMDDFTSPQKAIHSFSPPGTLTASVATLPGWEGRANMAHVWTGSAAHLFGGNSNGGTSREADAIEVTSRGAVRQTEYVFPYSFESSAAVFDGHAAYLFGGLRASKLVTSDIMRHVPGSASAEVLGVRLPEERSGLAAVWTGDAAYIFGGGSAQVWKFQPPTHNGLAPSPPSPPPSPPRAESGPRFAASCPDPHDSDGGGLEIVRVSSRQVTTAQVEIRVTYADSPQRSYATHSLTVDFTGDGQPDLSYDDYAHGTFDGRRVIWGSYPLDEGNDMVYPIQGNGFDPASLPGKAWNIEVGAYNTAGTDKASCPAAASSGTTAPPPTGRPTGRSTTAGSASTGGGGEWATTAGQGLEGDSQGAPGPAPLVALLLAVLADVLRRRSSRDGGRGLQGRPASSMRPRTRRAAARPAG